MPFSWQAQDCHQLNPFTLACSSHHPSHFRKCLTITLEIKPSIISYTRLSCTSISAMLCCLHLWNYFKTRLFIAAFHHNCRSSHHYLSYENWDSLDGVFTHDSNLLPELSSENNRHNMCIQTRSHQSPIEKLFNIFVFLLDKIQFLNPSWFPT
jgi:hypothetical protein